MKTKVSTPRSFLSAASRSVSTVGLIAVFACGAAAQQQWTGPDAGNNISNANTGNVGIGTPNPGSRLHVSSSGLNAEIRITDTTTGNPYLSFYDGATPKGYVQYSAGTMDFYAPTGVAARIVTNSTERLRINVGGNVGIGTTTPLVKLHTKGAGFWESASLNGVSITPGATLQTIASDWNSGGADTPLLIKTQGGGNQLYLATSGNVGIGKSNPTVALDVQGDIKASGTIFAKYQDLAEWVPSSEQLSPGTVVALDTTKSNQVISSTVSYDTRVAGVISAQPGITLGEGGEGKVLVATTGRVRVKVDASRGAIQIGDLLVTSDVSGVAMKSEAVEFAGRKMHMPGTIIGKALEPLAKGAGEILVLLSLQ